MNLVNDFFKGSAGMLLLALAIVIALALIAVIVLLILRKNGNVRSQVWIDAPPEIVWQVLLAVAEYPSWNPFMTRVSADFIEGRAMRIRFGQPGHGAMELAVKVLTVQPHAELHWKGQVLLPGLFDGEHRIALTRDGSGTLVRQDETFSGLLVGRLTRSVLESTRKNFEAMDAALKERAEEKARQLLVATDQRQSAVAVQSG